MVPCTLMPRSARQLGPAVTDARPVPGYALLGSIHVRTTGSQGIPRVEGDPTSPLDHSSVELQYPTPGQIRSEPITSMD